MSKHLTTIRIADGKLTAIYKDGLGLQRLPGVKLRRASHVEPVGLQWTADMSPVGGPLLGPFDTHQEAIEKEVEWLRNNL